MPTDASTPARDDSRRDPPFPRRPRLRRMIALAGGAFAVAGAIAAVGVAGSSPSPARSGGYRIHVGNREASAAHARREVGPPAKLGSATGNTNRVSTAGAGRMRNATQRPQPPQTSCRSVGQIGDSTSVDLISPSFIPNPAQRLAARYAAVGVRHLRVDASGGRSIVEELPGQLNGYKVASAWRSNGYLGCLVFALGTNDTADIAAGSSIGMMARIDQMMAVAHGEPVMWVNTRTLLSSGPWANANERQWDQTLVRALAKYPNMRIFNWSAVARPSWFLTDGIHYNTEGCIMRAKAIADALARAFPLSGHSTGKIVR